MASSPQLYVFQTRLVKQNQVPRSVVNGQVTELHAVLLEFVDVGEVRRAEEEQTLAVFHEYELALHLQVSHIDEVAGGSPVRIVSRCTYSNVSQR